MRKCWTWSKSIFLSTIRTVRSLHVSLRYKILSVVFLAIVLPAFFFGVILTSLNRAALRESIFHRQQETLHRLADRINTQIEHHQNILSAHRGIGRLQPPAQSSAAAAILAQGRAFLDVTIVNPGGREVFRYRRDGGLGRAGRRAPPLVRDSSYVSQVYFSDQRNPYLILSEPLAGKKGVLAAKLDFEQLWQWIAEVRIGDTGQAFIVDRKGNLVAHREPERVRAHSNFKTLPIVRDFMDHQTIDSSRDWREYRDERGNKVVALYRVIPRLGWAVVIQVPSREAYAPVRAMYRTIAFWTLVWSAVFLLVGYHIVQRIVRPLGQLQAGAEQIARGKLDIALDIHTGDEVEMLAMNFERMATALRQSEALKQSLTSMIVHDLKSPLSGIMGSLDYIESGMMGAISDDQKKMLGLAKKASEAMLTMVQTLLDVAKMEEGKLELRRELVHVGVLVEERVGQYAALAAGERKILAADIEPGIPQVSVEKNLIERVINNLISNALHHTAAGGHITVAARRRDTAVEVRVEDDGAGIPPEYIDRIFEKFVQVVRRQAKLRTGAGLGLTFCKMVVETHGGSIRVESQLNKGSCFIFTIPL